MIESINEIDFNAITLVHAIFFAIIGILFILTGKVLLICFGIILVAFGLLFPFYWLMTVIKQRHLQIQRALPNVLDILTLSVEAGRDFLTALQDIIKYRKSDPLNEELERVFLEIQLGIQRRDALKNMANRVQQNDLSTVIDSLIQADEFGVSIGAILHVLAEQMRSKRFNRAEKLANEAPVKILIPLVLFIFPAILIIFLGPVFMHALRNM